MTLDIRFVTEFTTCNENVTDRHGFLRPRKRDNLMPGPCSRPVGGKTKFVRATKNKGAEPKHGYPPRLAARIKELPSNVSGKLKYNRPGSYKR